MVSVAVAREPPKANSLLAGWGPTGVGLGRGCGRVVNSATSSRMIPNGWRIAQTKAQAIEGSRHGVTPHESAGATHFEVELGDAWVWDMYRPARFVSSVKVVTFRDVNVEALPEKEI